MDIERALRKRVVRILQLEESVDCRHYRVLRYNTSSLESWLGLAFVQHPLREDYWISLGAEVERAKLQVAFFLAVFLNELLSVRDELEELKQLLEPSKHSVSEIFLQPYEDSLYGLDKVECLRVNLCMECDE